MTPDPWDELARQFRDGAARHPDFRVLVIEFPVPAWGPGKPPDEPPGADSERIGRWYKENPGVEVYKLILGDIRYPKAFANESTLLFGQMQVYYGGDATAMAWLRFAELARAGIELAVQAGVTIGPLPPDRGPAVDNPKPWAGAWVMLVHRLAKQRRPDSILRAQETRVLRRRPLPDGVTLSSLPVGVFTASAYAADLLAGSGKDREDKITPRVSAEPPSESPAGGGGVTVAERHDPSPRTPKPSPTSSVRGNITPSGPVILTPRQAIILDFLSKLELEGPSPRRGKLISLRAGLHYDPRIRTDLSTLCKLGFLRNDGAGYVRTDQPYPCP